MSNESDHESLSAQDASPSEVEQLVTRLHALQNKGLPPRDFLPEFLQHTLTSIAAVGGAIWSSTSLGLSLECLQGMRDTGIDDDERDRQRHVELLIKVMDDGEPAIIPPRLDDDSVEATGDGNSSLYWLLIVPFRGPDGIALALEAYLRRGGSQSFRQNRLRVVVLATKMGSQYLEHRQLRKLAEGGAEKSPDRDQFDLAVHASLDLRRTAYTIAHEARRFLDVDRVTVTVERRGQQRVVAISNQESFDSRAAAVQALEKLATTIAAVGEPFSYLGVHSDLAPQIHAALQAHLEQSHSQVVFVVPLHRGATAQADVSRQPGEPIGAMVIECFLANRDREDLPARIAQILPHCQVAIGNAHTYEDLFLMPLWRMLGHSRVLVSARHWPKTALAAAAAVCLALVLLIVPNEFELEGRGLLLPVQRREVFAEVDGEVTKVLVEHGQLVHAGDVLCELKNVELEVQLAGIAGQISSTVKKLRAAEQALLANARLSEYERSHVHGERLQARQELKGLQEQSALLERKQQQLQVKSPIAGQVVTWSAHETLMHRPVKRGDVLLSVVDPAQEWELEIRMPEERMGHMMAARETKHDTPVRFILATQPGRTLQGVVQEVHERAEVRGDEGNTVLVRVKFDQSQLTAPRPGAEVTARIACGRRALGYVWLHEVWAFVESRILFRI